jgi:hypothetical protein
MLRRSALAWTVATVIDREQVGAKGREQFESIAAAREVPRSAMEIKQCRQSRISSVVASVDAHTVFRAQPNISPRTVHHSISVVPTGHNLFARNQHTSRAHICNCQRRAEPTRKPAPSEIFTFR